MIKFRHLLLVLSFSCLLPPFAFSQAPVVDDSENYALLDEQVAKELPVDRELYDNDEERALASDSFESSSHDNVMLDKLKGLQQELQELRGQLEVQSNDLKQMQQQQLAFYKDLDARIGQAPAKIAKKNPTELSINPEPSATIPLTPPPSLALPKIRHNARSNPADEQISYLAAYELVKNKQYEDAIIAMQNFVNHYPQGGYTANAQYWLGELFMVKKNYPEAIEHFETVLQQFPSSSKSAASMLKIGYALAASGKRNEAKIRLQNVVKNYPDTNTAQLAITKLESFDS